MLAVDNPADVHDGRLDLAASNLAYFVTFP
jgi:hypothetical protein